MSFMNDPLWKSNKKLSLDSFHSFVFIIHRSLSVRSILLCWKLCLGWTILYLTNIYIFNSDSFVIFNSCLLKQKKISENKLIIDIMFLYFIFLNEIYYERILSRKIEQRKSNVMDFSKPGWPSMQFSTSIGPFKNCLQQIFRYPFSLQTFFYPVRSFIVLSVFFNRWRK